MWSLHIIEGEEKVKGERRSKRVWFFWLLNWISVSQCEVLCSIRQILNRITGDSLRYSIAQTLKNWFWCCQVALHSEFTGKRLKCCNSIVWWGYKKWQHWYLLGEGKMAAKLLHSLADDNPDLQKQIGCMTGIFQLFDRHHVVVAKCLSHKRLTAGNHHWIISLLALIDVII